MKERRHFLAGLAVLLGLLVLVVAVIGILARSGAWPLLQRTYSINVLFDRGAELSPGTRVIAGGQPVGRVRNVTFMDPDSLVGGVVAEIAVQHDHKLRRGSRARLVESARGGLRVEILPGPRDEVPLEAGSTISGEAPSGTSAMLSPELAGALDKTAAQVGDAADVFRTVLADLHAVIRPTRPGAVDRAGGAAGNLASAAERLDTTLAGINTVLGDPTIQAELKETVHNLHEMSKEMRETTASAKQAFEQVRAAAAGSEKLVAHSEEVIAGVGQRVDGVTRNLNQTLELAADLFRQISPLAAKVARGEGSLGKLIQDDQLHEALLVTLRRLAAEKPPARAP